MAKVALEAVLKGLKGGGNFLGLPLNRAGAWPSGGGRGSRLQNAT